MHNISPTQHTKMGLFPKVGMKLQGHLACPKLPPHICQNQIKANNPSVPPCPPTPQKKIHQRNKMSSTGNIPPQIDIHQGDLTLDKRAN